MCLYTGVVLHELHLANMIYVKRKWGLGNAKELAKLMREARESIIGAKEVLKYETNTPSGEKLHNLMNSSQKEFDRWITKYKVNLDKEFE